MERLRVSVALVFALIPFAVTGVAFAGATPDLVETCALAEPSDIDQPGGNLDSEEYASRDLGGGPESECPSSETPCSGSTSGTIQVLKSGTPFQGLRFYLYRVGEDDLSHDERVEALTDSGGIAVFEGVAPGRYRLCEEEGDWVPDPLLPLVLQVQAGQTILVPVVNKATGAGISEPHGVEFGETTVEEPLAEAGPVEEEAFIMPIAPMGDLPRTGGTRGWPVRAGLALVFLGGFLARRKPGVILHAQAS